MLARMVKPKKQKKVSDGSGFPAHGVKPDSRRDRLREMFFTVQASGYPATVFLCCLLLTFALAAAQSPEGRYVSCVEPQISASESYKQQLRQTLICQTSIVISLHLRRCIAFSLRGPINSD